MLLYVQKKKKKKKSAMIRPIVFLIFLLVVSRLDQRFETQTGPYGPIGLTGNRFLRHFFNFQNPFYTENPVDHANLGQTVRIWELWTGLTVQA